MRFTRCDSVQLHDDLPQRLSMKSTIAMSSLRKDSPRTFLAAHDSAYSKSLSQIGCCIRLPRFTRGSVWILAYFRGLLVFLARTFGVRKAAGLRRQTSEFDLAVVTSPITYVASSSDRFAGLCPSERGCPCTRMKTACDLVTPSRVSRRFRGGFSFNAGLRDLGDALSPAKANLLDGNT